MGRVGNHYGRPVDIGEHPVAGAVLGERAQPRLDRRIALGLLVLVLDVLVRHPQRALPAQPRPDEIARDDDDGGDGHSRDQTDRDRQDQFGQLARIDEHGVHGSCPLRAQEQKGNDTDRQEFNEGFQELDLTRGSEDSRETRHRRHPRPFRRDPVENEARQVLQKRGAEAADRQDQQDRQQEAAGCQRHAAEEQHRVAAGLQGEAARIVEERREVARELRRLPPREQGQRDQQAERRGKDRRLARERDVALLDRVAHPPLGGGFGLALLVVVRHASAPPMPKLTPGARISG